MGGSTTSLTYDQAERLTAYGPGATYAYNGDGLRQSKTVVGATSVFVWDSAANLIKDGATSYVYGPGGMPLEQVTSTTVLYFHQDQLGSTRALTDAAGAVQATYTYDAYGNLAASTGMVANSLK